MSTQTTCDLCGEPITEEQERVDVRVDPRSLLPRRSKRPSSLEALTKESESLSAALDRKEKLRLSLDCHQDCYVERILPTLAPFGEPS